MNFLWNLIFKRDVKVPLTQILEQTLAYLEKSEDSIWSDMEVDATVKLINKQLHLLKSSGKVNVSKLNYLFLPTAPLQEIAMENGWVDEYLKLAEQFDSHMAKYC
ncbi:hypothetical protein A9267_10525 [Shewanella sp. UCD-FRSSP16_17]|uniref:hypothetical protein n=1 Tax=Shewanella sp. UCD-FRSSP16_17 TaxID=1853256 RepID=UPI0007EE9B6F|nr:hypothetical protein [Shewanella sp. UCD-FRSSP16_17]MBQ4889390.1 hypothetical protein [Shewanella sp. MMG014]OBT08146.1 hypothetical protein A9267_10525 [Shewanella sp. UCD-FRSSP16_17]